MDEGFEDFELQLFRAAQADLAQHAVIDHPDVSALADQVMQDGTYHRSGRVLPANHRSCRIPRHPSERTMSVKWG